MESLHNRYGAITTTQVPALDIMANKDIGQLAYQYRTVEGCAVYDAMCHDSEWKIH